MWIVERTVLKYYVWAPLGKLMGKISYQKTKLPNNYSDFSFGQVKNSHCFQILPLAIIDSHGYLNGKLQTFELKMVD